MNEFRGQVLFFAMNQAAHKMAERLMKNTDLTLSL